jgi:D-inositol-3-phosphate glycosyltransferase
MTSSTAVPGPSRPRRALAVLSVHTSPLGDLGRGENGGMNLVVRRLCAELAARGVPSDVFTRRDDPGAPAEELIASGSRLIRIPAGPPRPLPKHQVLAWLPQLTAGVVAHAASEGREYRLVHSHYWLSGWVARGTVQRWRVPWVHSFHTLARVKAAAGLPAEPQRAEAEAVLARAADRLVAMSLAEQADLVSLYRVSPERICVVPPGVDLEQHAPRPVGAIRRRMHLDGRRVVLYVGRLEPLKGAEMLIDAAALLAADPTFSDVVTLVAGDDSGDGSRQAEPYPGERARLMALAAQRGIARRVRFLGAVPHAALADLYALADVCVVPSLTESFGLVALEAQASGTPVVATAVGGLRDIVADGLTGHLVRGRDPAAFARRIGELLSDRDGRARMGEAARRRAALYSWERSADRLLSLYDCVESPEPVAPLETCACL